MYQISLLKWVLNMCFIPSIDSNATILDLNRTLDEKDGVDFDGLISHLC